MSDFDGRVVVVSGAGNGIGRAVALQLRHHDAIVICLDKDQLALDQLSRDFQSLNNKSHFICMDLTSLADIKKLSELLRGKVDRIDSIINIAANANFETLTEDFEPWIAIMSGSVASYSVLCRHLLDLMKVRGGTIVNMASISAHIAQHNFGTYAASKAAVIALTKCMANDLAPFGIRVNSVSPATVWTQNNAFYINRDYGFNREQADKHPDIGGKHILSRCADPDEIASPILFLASGKSSFMTGTDILVDGGYTAI